jgi:hypothetical protein
MGGRREIRISQTVAGQPWPGREQITDIMQVVTHIRAGGPDHARIGRPAAGLRVHEALVDLLGDEVARHLVVELGQEPVEQAAHLDALGRLRRQEPPLAEPAAAGLVEVFGDDGGAGDEEPLPVHEHRRGAGRIDGQELGAPLPRPLLAQLRLDAALGEGEPREARVRAERVMVQNRHGRVR